jgi:SAM-dependent methyltransferase
VADDLPLLFHPAEAEGGRTDVTSTVKAFYEETPFPNYDDLDSRESLARKAMRSIFARLLDEQIPAGHYVLEAGCGTGQLTNFLGMSWGRVVIGADICLNSLRLAKQFRDRYSIRNANFIQMNLFRPAFRPGSFDVVISNGVLHHTADPEGGFRGLLQLLKPGGHFIVGLYNRLGRLPTDWRRILFQLFGDRLGFLDSRLRGDSLNQARWQAWFRDQYKHPHESKHSFDEVLRWFQAAGVHYVFAIPKPSGGPLTDVDSLFEESSPGTWIDRLHTQLGMLLQGGSEGGLFVMIGRKGDG